MSNIKRLGNLVKELGADWAVLTGADSICAVTGHVVPIEIGQSPFSGGPSVVLVSRDGVAGVVCPNTDGGQQAGNYEELTYAGFANEVTDQVGHYRKAVSEMAAKLGVSGKIVYEANTFPYALQDLLPDSRTPFDHDLARLRAVKSAVEIEKMTRAAQVAAIGQAEARRLSVPGADELEVFGGIRSKMEQAAGQRIAFAGEYLTGIEHSSTLGRPIGRRTLQDGDPIICDLAPRVNGYWGDSCNGFVVGNTASEGFRALHAAAKETLELAVSELRPGLRVCDFDATLRAHMKSLGYSYPHHSGHGIGASVHEFPRLVPDETSLFEENMFIMVEPGDYLADVGGLRCETMLRVTATGSEVVAPFELTCE